MYPLCKHIEFGYSTKKSFKQIHTFSHFWRSYEILGWRVGLRVDHHVPCGHFFGAGLRSRPRWFWGSSPCGPDGFALPSPLRARAVPPLFAGDGNLGDGESDQNGHHGKLGLAEDVWSFFQRFSTSSIRNGGIEWEYSYIYIHIIMGIL